MIIFARHAQTVAGEEERFEGLADSPLTRLGHSQSKALGLFLHDKRIEKVIVSPRKRARVTASLAISGLQVIFRTDSSLAEVCYGSWENQKKEEVKKTIDWEKRKSDPFHYVHPGLYRGHKGESYAMLFERVKDTLQTFINCNDNVLVVSHLGILRCVYMFFSGIDEKKFASTQFANTVLCIISRENTISFFDYFYQKEVFV